MYCDICRHDPLPPSAPTLPIDSGASDLINHMHFQVLSVLESDVRLGLPGKLKLLRGKTVHKKSARPSVNVM